MSNSGRNSPIAPKIDVSRLAQYEASLKQIPDDSVEDDDCHNMSPSSAITMSNPFSKLKNRKAPPSRFQSYLSSITSLDQPLGKESNVQQQISDEFLDYEPSKTSLTSTQQRLKDNIVTQSIDFDGFDALIDIIMEGEDAMKILDFVKAENCFNRVISSPTTNSQSAMSKMQAFESLGMIYDIYGKYEVALKHYKNSLELISKNLGEKHPLSSQIYDKMTLMHINLGNYDDAVTTSKASLDLRKAKLGSNHNLLARSYVVMTECEIAMGTYIKAEEYGKLAVHLAKKDVKNFTSIENLTLADAYQALGHAQRKTLQIDLARVSFEYCLKLKSEIFQSEHPYLASIYTHLAFINLQMGSKKIARSFLGKAKKCFIYTEGLANIEKIRYNSILSILEAEDKNIESASALAYNAYSLTTEAFKEKHVERANVLANLGNVSISNNEPEKALKFYEDSYYLKAAVFGYNHPDLIESIVSIVIVNIILARHEKAMDWTTEKLLKMPNVYGPSNLITAMCYYGAGFIFYSTEDYKTSLEYYTKAYKIFKDTFGTAHWSLIEIMEYLAGCYKNLEKFEYAAEFYQTSLENRLKHKIEDDVRMIELYKNLATVYNELKDDCKARSCFEKAIALTQRISGPKDNELGPLYIGLAILTEQTKDYSASYDFYKKGLEIIVPNESISQDEVLVAYDGLGRVGTRLNKQSDMEKFESQLMRTITKQKLLKIDNKQKNKPSIMKLMSDNLKTKSITSVSIIFK